MVHLLFVYHNIIIKHTVSQENIYIYIKVLIIINHKNWKRSIINIEERGIQNMDYEINQTAK